MRINDHWTRNNIYTGNSGLSDLFARIIEYKNNFNDSKFCNCQVSIKRNGNMGINTTVRNHLYFSQLPNELFSLKNVFWNTTPNAVRFHFTQENESELREFLAISSYFDASFSEIADDILHLLTQFSYLDYHQDSSRVTFFSDEVVNKSGNRRQREEESYLQSDNTFPD